MALLLIGLLAAIATEPTRQLIQQSKRIAGLATQLQDLESSNAALEARIERLKDPSFIEQEARAQIGLVRPGETTYVVMSADRKASAKRKTSKKDSSTRSPDLVVFVEGLFEFIGIS